MSDARVAILQAAATNVGDKLVREYATFPLTWELVHHIAARSWLEGTIDRSIEIMREQTAKDAQLIRELEASVALGGLRVVPA